MSNEMWTAFEQYQPYADKAGHGDTWRKMTQKRTAESMRTAYADAAFAGGAAADAAYAADAALAAQATVDAAEAAWYEAKAIKCIERAIKEAQS